MKKRTIFVIVFTLILVLAAFAPLSPKAVQPANDMYSYAESQASLTIREINIVRPSPLGTYSAQIITHSGLEAFGLGATPQTALDNAISNLP